MFLKWRGFNIDNGLFNITFCPPQNFASYRQSELDQSRVSTFANLEPLPYFSKRFLMQRFLGLTEEEISENEKLWQEERGTAELETTQGQDLRAIGVTPAGLEADITAGEEISAELGAEGGAPGAAAAGQPGAAPPAGTPVPAAPAA
jgi:hypothetical protein